ncbi:MAG: orotidine-5'-phosphate decarboxylase [Dehalococcoidia bacterium]
MTTFLDKLDAAARRNRSLLCVGLDPWPPLMPKEGIASFSQAIVEATADLVCAFKPNIAFYEAQGSAGLVALEQTLATIPDDVPVILDAKRGDIGNTAIAYAQAVFETWGADAVTVSPYLGRDSVEPFLAYEGKGVFVLCRTSNPGGSDLQALQVTADGQSAPLYEQVARLAERWNDHGNVGLVVGATVPGELARVRELCPHMPILVPGVGAQGGDLEASVRLGTDASGRRAVISVSRQVLYASGGSDYAQAARQAAQALREQINAVLAALGWGW